MIKTKIDNDWEIIVVIRILCQYISHNCTLIMSERVSHLHQDRHIRPAWLSAYVVSSAVAYHTGQ